MSDKNLSEKEWKSFSKGKDFKDAALLKAFAALEKAERAGPEEQLQALAEIEKQIDTLLKAHKGDKDLAAQLDDVNKALNKDRKIAEQAAKQADKHAEAEQAGDDEEESPALLTTKMVPLLREVRKGSVMHVMVAMAGKDTVVMVSRKPIGAPRRKLLSSELGTTGGVKFVLGECLFEENAHTFVMQTRATGLAKKLKAALLKQTEQRFKVRVRGEDPNDIDDDGEPAEPDPDAAPGATTTAAPLDRSPQFNARLAALMPKVKAALVAAGPTAQEIKLKVSEAGMFARKQDFDRANALLDDTEKLLKAADAAKPAAPPLAPAGASGGAADAAQTASTAKPPAAAAEAGVAFNARLAALMPRVKDAMVAAGTTAQDIKLKTSEAGMFARKSDFAQANAVLDEVLKLLGEAATGMPATATAPAPASDESVAFNVRLAALLPKVKDAIGAGRADAQDIKLKVSEAGMFARKKDLATANALLADVELALAKAQDEVFEPETTTEAEEPTGDPAETRYFDLFNLVEADYLAAIKASGSDNKDISDQIAKLKLSWGRAADAAEAENYSNAVLILQKLVDDEVLTKLQQAKRDAAADSKPSGIVAQRTFMLERWARIPTELKVELQSLQKTLESTGGDDNPGALTDAIEAHLNKLMADLQNQIDAGINAGNMNVFKNLRQRVEQDSVIGHLLKAPFMNGSKFKQVALDAMDEIEAALTA
ncbi:hypothetical protein ACVBEH_08840 [Roseateles sp. GG27B]